MTDAKKPARKRKQKKPSFVERMKSRGHEARRLGVTLKDEPGQFPAEVQGVLRRSLRKVWRARGGGLYACGFVVTFVILEVRMLILDIFEAESVGAFFTEQATEMVFKYLGESIQNTVSAFIWPVHILQWNSPWGIGILVLMFVVFDRLLKAPLERWLFDDAPAEDAVESS